MTGPDVVVLRARDLDRPREKVVWLPSSFGVGLLLVGWGRVILRRGPRPVLQAAALVAAAGAALLTTGPARRAAARRRTGDDRLKGAPCPTP